MSGQVVVGNPIINNPYREPESHWSFAGLAPEQVPGRRPAGYLAPDPTGQLKIADEVIPLELVNDLRARVVAWRADDYRGATEITKSLFRGWFDDARIADTTRPFFTQQEAIETVAFLVEASPDLRVGITVPDSGEAYERWATKMATGAGKTLVMALTIAWCGINRAANRQDTRFTDSFLVVAPNLTVRHRLSGEDGVDPRDENSVYNLRNLIPPTLGPLFAQVRVQVLNWHQLAPKEDPKRSVVKRGPESDGAFARRVLVDLPRNGRLVVINDEAHHAWRLPPDAKITAADRDEVRAATVWIDGLERIHRVRGILRCHDYSATPMYPGQIKGKAWTPFEWVISDFALVDAIESGLVKIPRTPTDDDAGRSTPKYRHLWQHIKDVMPKRGDAGADSHPLTDYLAEADGPLKQMAGEWEETFEAWADAGRPVPPVMIVVCHDTTVARLVERHVAELGEVGPELVNHNGQLRTLRIDSDALAKAEAGEGSQAAEAAREIVATVGRIGLPGEQIRCLVSVAMLAEGWDARNVTQILGLRAFQSQLLCEQVVGRGLRRSDYSDLTKPEFVDVYGVPFQLLPIAKGGDGSPSTPPDYLNVHTVPERDELRIRFPRVVQIVPDVVDTLAIDIDAIEAIRVMPANDPTQTWVEFDLGSPHGGMGGETQDRERAYGHFRLQRLLFRVAAGLIRPYEKPWLFPDALRIAERVCRPIAEGGRIDYAPGVDRRELCNFRYLVVLQERIAAALMPGEAGDRYLPALDEYAPIGTTDALNFNAPRDRCVETKRSHLSHAVCDSGLERQMCAVLDDHPDVEAWVKNHRLFLEVPYLYMGKAGHYRPDFVVRFHGGHQLLLEGKGHADEADDSKATAARMWVAGINTWGQLGTWSHAICYDANDLAGLLARHRDDPRAANATTGAGADTI